MALLFAALNLAAYADEPSVASPNKLYLIRLVHKPDAVYPVITLRDARTGREAEVFDYDNVAEGTQQLEALWSPDSRHVALTIRAGPATFDTIVYRIEDGKATEIGFLPLAKELDIKSHSFRGGTFATRWDDNRTLWVLDNTKSRSFRCRLTKNGNLRADAFKDEEPD